MFKPTRRTLTAATVVFAASAPTAAYARFDLNPPAPSATSGQALSTIAQQSASPPQGFHWDDAGIGAAGVLVLIGLGSGATIARRHRSHNSLAR